MRMVGNEGIPDGYSSHGIFSSKSSSSRLRFVAGDGAFASEALQSSKFSGGSKGPQRAHLDEK